MARATGFNKPVVAKFFENLTTLMEDLSIDCSQIFNLDETGITNVSVCSKVIAPTGRKQVGMITAAERGLLVTVLGIISADGNTIPPVMVFLLKKVPPTRLIQGAPPGTLGVNSATGSGWMTAEIFVDKVLPHVVKHTSATKNNPILVLLDNHASHISLDTITFCRANGVHLLTFPPHCSHKMQPLDVSVYGPMKAAYKRAMHDWQTMNPGTRITLYDMGAIFGRAFDLSFTRKNIINGFRATGICPVNTDIFNDEDFLPATVHIPEVLPAVPQLTHDISLDENQPQPIDEVVTPESVRPLPRLLVNERKPGRRKGTSVILTSSPETHQLEKYVASKLEKSKRKSRAINLTRPRPMSGPEEATTSRGDHVRCDNEPDEHFLASMQFEDSDDQVMDDGDLEKNIAINDFIVARVYGQSDRAKGQSYVAQVVMVSEEVILVKFLERQTSLSKAAFVFPEIIDEATVSRQDVLCRLPTPSSGTTPRTRGLFTFEANLVRYGIF